MDSAVADHLARTRPMSAQQQLTEHQANHHRQQRYLTPPFSPPSSSNNVPTVDKTRFQQGHAAHQSLPPQALFAQIPPNQHLITDPSQTSSRIPTYQGGRPPAQFHMPIGSAPLSPPAHTDEQDRMFPPTASSHGYPSSSGPPSADVEAAKKRATYNPPPSGSIVRSNSHQPSMFSKDQVMSPEYTLHPSIAAYQQSHPRRQLINFGPYILLQTLGEGEFGKVKLGVHREYGEEVAIKLIRRGSVDNAVRLSKVEREIDVLKTVKHPNIVRLFDVIETEKYIGIILDFANGGELFDHILAHRYLKDKDASKLFAQLISGVHYLHRKKIVHRDLKLENLLLDKHRNVIITDFGFANRFEHRQDDLMATSCGSPCYAAPELVVSDGLYVGSAVDIWSCGVILYAMLSGYLPFDDDPENPDGDNINLLYKYILNTPLTFPDWVSPAARDLMSRMLIPDPEHRFTLEQVMNHQWLEPYRPLFARNINEMETIAQEQMLHKRQASRRDMQARMKAREAARLNQLAQSAGVVPGQQQQSLNPAVAAQDHQRRHKSDMPMGFNMSASPMMAPNGPRPIAAAPNSEQRTGMSPHSAQPIITSGLPPPAKQAVSTPTALLSGTLSGSLPAESLIQSASRIRKEEDIAQDPVANEADARASARARPDDGPGFQGLNREGPAKRCDAGRARDDSPSSSASKKRSVSENTNRHTIQVEYDGDTAYQRLLKVQADREDARSSAEVQQSQGEGSRMHIDPVEASASSPHEVSPVAFAPTVSASADNQSTRQPLTPMESQGAPTEHMEVDPVFLPAGSISKEPISSTAASIRQNQQDIPAPASPVLSPSAIRLVPPTPVKDPIASSTTPKPAQKGPPRTELPLFAEDRTQAETAETSPPRSQLPVPTRLASSSTYSSSGSNPQTPRMEAVSGRPEIKISTQSRQPSIASTASLAVDLAPSPSVSLGSHASGSTGASVPGKKDRSRKGMSMNSFGFGKLLSNANMSTDSVSNPGPRVQPAKESGGFLSRSGSVRDKAKKRAEPAQAPATKSELPPSSGTVVRQTLTPGSKQPPATSVNAAASTPIAREGSAQSRNSLVIVQADKLLPPHPAERSASNISITQFDTFRNDERPAVVSPRPQHTASSSAAQKVMNWFRRKSYVKSSFVPPPPTSREASASNNQAPSRVQGASIAPSPTPRPTESTPLSRDDKENTSPSSSPRPEETLSATAAATETKLVETVIQAPQPRRSVAVEPPSVSKLPRPATVGRDLVKQTETKPTPQVVNSVTSSPFNEARLRVHVGVVDQSALTSKGALEVMEQVLKVLYGMGIEVKRENDFKLRCFRARRKKAGAMTGLGLSTFSNGSIASMATLTNASSSNQVDKRGLPLPNSPSGLLAAPGGFRSMLMRRGSSQTGISGGSASPEMTTSTSPMSSPREGAVFASVPEPTYGEHSVDPGDEVRFSIELTRLKNLPGLLSLDIKRLRGNVWSFKFVYQTILERCELTH